MGLISSPPTPAATAEAVVRRQINGQVNATALAAVTTTAFADQSAPTYDYEIAAIKKAADALSQNIPVYNAAPATVTSVQKRKALVKFIGWLQEIFGSLEWLIPALSRDPSRQTDADKQTYRELIALQAAATRVAESTNNEAAALMNIARAGPGGRPDAHGTEAIIGTVESGVLGLSESEEEFRAAFVENQGGSWKEQKEALTGIWAKQAGIFDDLSPGKGNKYGADVEYRTEDAGEPELWDQKTMLWGERGFEGRLTETHEKNTDDNGKNVGLLFDSTYERSQNYEKSWLVINEAVLSGKIPPEYVKEVVAPNPELLRAEIYVDMTLNYGSSGPERNVKWAEGKLNGVRGGLPLLPPNQLAQTNLPAIQGGQERPFSRYTNNRQWLASGVYDEYPAKGGGIPNEGTARFVVLEGGAEIYFTPTHYKGFTVKPAGAAPVTRQPFYRVV